MNQPTLKDAGRSLVAIGGTAVGTGMNAHPRFGEMVATRLAAATGQPFVATTNKFAALSGQDAMVRASRSVFTAPLGFGRTFPGSGSIWQNP
jgi:fumarate hydratase class II